MFTLEIPWQLLLSVLISEYYITDGGRRGVNIFEDVAEF